MPVDKDKMKQALDEFNAQGKSLEDIELENENQQEAAMKKNADDPELQKIWAEAKKDAEADDDIQD